MARHVTLVTGPPCAGKTTYVQRHAQPGDLVLDQDTIGAAAMREALARVAAMRDGTAWVIRCAPGQHHRDRLAQQIRATDTVHLRPPDAELINRAAHRPNPRRHIQAVRDWLSQEAGHTQRGQQQQPRGRTTPRVGLTTTQRGYGWEHQQARAKAVAHLRAHPGSVCCPFCGNPLTADMPLDYDHYPPLALGGGGIRRLSCSPCNRRAGQQLAQQRRRLRTRTPRSTSTRTSRRW